MRRLLLPLVAVLLAVTAPERAGAEVVAPTTPTGATPAFRVPHFRTPTGPALVTFGHSFVSGAGAVEVLPTWTSRVAKDLRVAPSNRGMSGTTSDQILRVVRSYRPRAGDRVVIEAEINDARTQGARGLLRYRRNLAAMLRHVTRRGRRPAEILVLSDPRPLAWTGGPYDTVGVDDRGSDAILRRYAIETRNGVARFRGVRYLDLETGWDPTVDISTADTLHPNAAGVARIASAVSAALRPRGARRAR